MNSTSHYPIASLKYISLCIILFCLFPSLVVAQKEASNWYFGDYAGLRFHDDKPEVVYDGQLSTLEGCATISDPVTGVLLFYTDGNRIWNWKHKIMANGDLLFGAGGTSTQAALIIPYPGHRDWYYLFTTGNTSTPPYHPGLYYNVIDMSKKQGEGEVIRKNIRLLDSAGEKLTVTYHCNGKDWWVVSHSWKKNIFYSFRVRAEVMESAVQSTVGKIEKENGEIVFGAGYMRFSPDGKKLAMSVFGNGKDWIELFDFDTETGIVSNPVVLDETGRSYGLSFSPDNSKLYTYDYDVSESVYGGIVQYDIGKQTPEGIIASRTLIAEGKGSLFGPFTLGPDGKIYHPVVHNGWARYLSVIHKPNLAGTLCDYEDAAIYLGDNAATSFSLPNFPDCWFNEGLDGRVCSAPRAQFSGVSLCEGECATFSDESTIYPERWSWSFEGGIPAIYEGQSPPSVCYQRAGVYKATLIVSNNNGSDTLSQEVIVYARPIIEISPEQVMCLGDTIQLTASGGSVYKWSPSTGLSADTIASPRAFPRETTTYTVEVSNEYGCVSTASVRVRVEKTVKAEASGAEICSGGSAQLHASGGTSYHWSPSAGLDRVDVPDPIASPTESTVYQVIVWSGLSCSDTADVEVVVHPTPEAKVSSDVQVCAGESVRLEASGGVLYRWNPSDGLDRADIATPIARPERTTRYEVEVENEYGCVSRATVEVMVLEPVLVDAGADKSICAGSSVQLRAEGSGITVWFWSPSDGLSATDIANPVAKPEQATRYVVRAENSVGCVGYDTVDVLVYPATVVEAGADVAVCAGESIQLQGRGSEIVSWSWSPSAGLSARDISNPVASPQQSTRYVLRGVSASGCESLDSVLVSVVPRTRVVFRVGEVRATVGTAFDIPIVAEVEGGSIGAMSATLSLRVKSRVLRLLGCTGGVASSRLEGEELVMDVDVSNLSLSGKSEVALLHCTALLSADTMTTVMCAVSSDELPCVDVVCSSGRIAVDGICFAYNTQILERGIIRVSPDPATTDIAVTIEKVSGVVHLRLYDVYGREVWSVEQEASGEAVVIPIGVSEMGTGLYVLSVETPQERLVRTLRIVK